MSREFDLSKLKTSWTKFDIVQVMETVHNKETLSKYVNKEAKIDEPVLRAFLGVDSLDKPLPEFWLKIQNHPNEKNLFAFLCVLFTHVEIVRLFADEFSKGDMKGVFRLFEKKKEFTNIRSVLIESGAAEPFLRRADEVPDDLTAVFRNLEVGKLFKQVFQ